MSEEEDNINDLYDAIRSLSRAQARLRELYRQAKNDPSLKRKAREFTRDVAELKHAIRDYLRERVREEELYEDFRNLFPPEPYLSPPYTYNEDYNAILRDAISKYIINMSNCTGNYYEDVNKLRGPLIEIFRKIYDQYGPFKFIWKFRFIASYINRNDDILEYGNYAGVPPIVYNEDDIYEKVTDLIKSIIDQYIPDMDRESGYTYKQALDFSVYFYNYEAISWIRVYEDT